MANKDYAEFETLKKHFDKYEKLLQIKKVRDNPKTPVEKAELAGEIDYLSVARDYLRLVDNDLFEFIKLLDKLSKYEHKLVVKAEKHMYEYGSLYDFDYYYYHSFWWHVNTIKDMAIELYEDKYDCIFEF